MRLEVSQEEAPIEVLKKEAEKIVSKLGNNYTYRIIGFTVFIKKWRKPMR